MSKMNKRWTFLAIAVLAVALGACGGGSETRTACAGRDPESLTAGELVSCAYEAMTHTSFAADVPPEPPVPQEGQPRYSIKYGPPDLLLITGAGYEHTPYMFLVGTDEYGSETGWAWALGYGGHLARSWRFWWDPRELLRIATDLQDEGTEEVDGRVYRVVSSRPDVVRFAQLYITGLELQLKLEVPPACPDCERPCFDCSRSPDSRRLEGLDYRSPDGHWGALFKGQDIRIFISSGGPEPDHVYVNLRGVRDLSPDLAEELRKVLGAYGIAPKTLDTAETRLDDEGEQFLANDGRLGDLRTRFWIDPKAFLVGQMEIIEPGRRDEGPRRFIDYGEVTLPAPEPAMLVEEVDLMRAEVGRRASQLSRVLEAYAERHDGLYPPQTLAPDVVRDALETEGLEWPENPFTGEPMRETAERNPGDFHYEPFPDRHGHCTEVYDWYGLPHTVYPPYPGPAGPLGWEECLPPGGASP